MTFFVTIVFVIYVNGLHARSFNLSLVFLFGRISCAVFHCYSNLIFVLIFIVKLIEFSIQFNLIHMIHFTFVNSHHILYTNAYRYIVRITNELHWVSVSVSAHANTQTHRGSWRNDQHLYQNCVYILCTWKHN